MKTKRITIILVLVVFVTVMNISFIKTTGNSGEEPITTLAMENAVALAIDYECGCMVSCYYNYGGGCVIWDGGNCPYWPDFSPCTPIC